MAGNNREKKLTEIITPAAKPRDESSKRRPTFFVRNTVEAPRPVMNQVKPVARSTWTRGFVRRLP
jgi:hypothetical protein